MKRRADGVKVGVVVITCSKYADYLPKVMASLKAQTRSHDVVVFRNGSFTLGKAVNHALRGLPNHDYIVRVDGDDWIAPELLEVESRYLDEHPDIDCVWCDTVHARLHGSSEHHETYLVEPREETELVNSCGAMYRRRCWEKIGGYADRNHGENVDFWKRFHAAGFRSERLSVPLYYYRQHADNMHNDREAVARARAEI